MQCEVSNVPGLYPLDVGSTHSFPLQRPTERSLQIARCLLGSEIAHISEPLPQRLLRWVTRWFLRREERLCDFILRCRKPQEKKAGKMSTLVIIFLFSLMVLGVDELSKAVLTWGLSSACGQRFLGLESSEGSFTHMSASSWDSSGTSLHSLCGLSSRVTSGWPDFLHGNGDSEDTFQERGNNNFLRVENFYPIYGCFLLLFLLLLFKSVLKCV